MSIAIFILRGDFKKEIKDANYWMPRVLKMFDDYKIQRCIMIDDIHAKQPVDEKFIKSVVEQLTIKPDCVYLESEFISEAHKVMEMMDRKGKDFIQSNERLLLRERVEKYRTTTEFLLNWKDKEGGIKFSCPSLAATSYLTRLGYVKTDGVKTIYGKDLMIADQVLNFLSSSYVSVEDNAQSIVEITFKEAVPKISWFFY